MNIQKLSYNDSRNNHYLKLSLSADSDAIYLPSKYKLFTCAVSSVASSYTIQYSLSTQEQIVNNTAIWHNTILVDKTESDVIVIDSPVNFIRITTTGSCTVEFLGG